MLTIKKNLFTKIVWSGLTDEIVLHLSHKFSLILHSMFIFDLLKLIAPDVTPSKTKVHLATSNGVDNPLDVYLAGGFAEWQRWQTRRNFERPFVLALIALPTPNKWLFAGSYRAEGCEPRQSNYHYQLNEIDSCEQLNGRLIAHFERTGRQPYLNGDRWTDKMLLSQILPERLRIAEFPGYRGIDLSKDELDIIINQAVESWKAALSSVAGVYLVSDTKTGKLYVGSACGEGGIWQRWSYYSSTGHGGNVELKQLLKFDGPNRASHFKFSILEIADLHESREGILRRESHWKSVLLSRKYGLNSN